jgi:hypothetical protein
VLRRHARSAHPARASANNKQVDIVIGHANTKSACDVM